MAVLDRCTFNPTASSGPCPLVHIPLGTAMEEEPEQQTVKGAGMAEYSAQSLDRRVEELLENRYEELCSAVSGCIVEVLGIDLSQITPQSVLLDLGAQSVDFVDIAFRLEKAFNVTLPPSYLIPDAYTVEAFARAIAQQLATH